MKTIALWLWYRGNGFRGYQSQPRGPTVQDALESALTQLSVRGRPVPSGRTDLGVHARMQVIRVRLEDNHTPEELAQALRPLLPPDLGVALARAAPPGFHPQWHTESKEYRYRLCLDGRGEAAASGAGSTTIWQTPWEVDPEELEALVGSCVGTRDFSAFHEKSSAVRPRTLLSAELRALGRVDGRLLHEIRWVGRGFGRYQVRYLTGSAVATSAGLLNSAQFEEALSQAKPIPGVKAPAAGLILWEVRYPPAWNPFSEADRSEAEGAIPSDPPFDYELIRC